MTIAKLSSTNRARSVTIRNDRTDTIHGISGPKRRLTPSKRNDLQVTRHIFRGSL